MLGTVSGLLYDATELCSDEATLLARMVSLISTTTYAGVWEKLVVSCGAAVWIGSPVSKTLTAYRLWPGGTPK
jgi:hypothetical protein